MFNGVEMQNLAILYLLLKTIIHNSSAIILHTILGYPIRQLSKMVVDI